MSMLMDIVEETTWGCEGMWGKTTMGTAESDYETLSQRTIVGEDFWLLNL